MRLNSVPESGESDLAYQNYRVTKRHVDVITGAVHTHLPNESVEEWTRRLLGRFSFYKEENASSLLCSRGHATSESGSVTRIDRHKGMSSRKTKKQNVGVSSSSGESDSDSSVKGSTSDSTDTVSPSAWTGIDKSMSDVSTPGIHSDSGFQSGEIQTPGVSPTRSYESFGRIDDGRSSPSDDDPRGIPLLELP